MSAVKAGKPKTKKPCCGELSPEARDVLGLLGTCARAEGNELQYCRLIKQSDALVKWDGLPRHAEDHGLAPLAYTHLKTIDSLLPEDIQRALKGLYLRHRHANQVRGQALAEIVQALEVHGIRPLALKGAALAHLVYPQPGLRPMRDLDILVPKADLWRARQTLSSLGYTSDPVLERITPGDHHHIPGMQRYLEGLSVSVELHHNLFPETIYYRPLPYEALIAQAVSFEVNGATAYTLGYEDMLWHIYRHAAGPPLLISPLRLVWIADLVSLVEKFVAQIDWPFLRLRYPQVWNILPLLHFVSPWSQTIIERLEMDLRHEPAGIGQTYTGWPRSHWFTGDSKWNRRLLSNTFNPPEWWQRLFYGVGSPVSWLWTRWVRHPLHILEWRVHYWKEDFGRLLRSKTTAA